jgi:cysteinyl-tRNA synthetase
LKIYNTLTRRKEKFVPIRKGKVGIYVCGPTVYDYPHIGHARTYIAFDALVRYFRHRGYKVKYVMNITNVDDKIIKRANELGEDPIELAEKFENIFFEDMEALGIPRADFHPRVTDHIDKIIEIIKAIIENRYAYVANGDVYFSIRKVKYYGKLSRQSLTEMVAGARVEPSEKKRDPMDFALWKEAKEGEPSWDSPWGKGRPGWHIECSAMSSEYLGEQFDIHGGAMDLIFPHHENEILQSEAAFGKKPFVRYWVHTGFLNVEGEKMSKSLGNFITIRELLERYDPSAFRFFVLLSHYRSPIDFSYDALEKAKLGLERLYNALDYARLVEVTGIKTNSVREAKKKFSDALDNDFNTPRAIAVLFSLAKEINKLDKVGDDAVGFLEEALDVLGLKERTGLSEEARASILELIEELGGMAASTDDESLVKTIINLRNEYRRRGDYASSDRIRRKLGEVGVILEDTTQGTTWKFRL